MCRFVSTYDVCGEYIVVHSDGCALVEYGEGRYFEAETLGAALLEEEIAVATAPYELVRSLLVRACPVCNGARQGKGRPMH